jgi:UDP-N-acetylglucosamine diphosphorylase/glucosamine-1-phosphate N-acetyltransferase
MNLIEKRDDLRTIILAAGKGTRMSSDLAKVLHPLRGKPMLSYVVNVAREICSGEILVVVGHQAEDVKTRFSDQDLIFIDQKQLLGTGHAVLQARERLANYSGTVLILCGDVPLLRASTVKSLLDCHRAAAATVTVLTTILPDPTGYGRIVKGPGGDIVQIVEERDATEEVKNIKEINTGIYCIENPFLFEALMKINNNNAQKEYYLTDIVAVACNNKLKVGTLIADDAREVMGINTQDELQMAQLLLERMK